jgi:hypothetical protein
MNKVSIALTPGLVLALALGAFAQEKPITTSKDNKDTIHVAVSGNVQLDYVWRSQEITGFTSTPAPIITGPATAHSENTFEGFVAVRLDVELSDKVSAVFEMGTKRVNNGNIDFFGTAGAQDIFLREARVQIADLLTQGLTLGVGITNWTFDVQGRGNSFAFDLRHSPSPAINLSTVADGAVTMRTRANTPQELEPVGFWVTWVNREITIDLVALPAVIEGGPASQDESFYAGDFWYALDSVGRGSKVGAIFAINHLSNFNLAAPVHATIFTVGGGANLRMLDGALDLFGEAYFQFGDGQNIPGTAAGQTARADGYALSFGAQYTIPNNPVWIGGKFCYLSGDNDAAPNKKIDSFISYEGNNDLMILQDMYLGLNWNTNYWAFTVNAGFAMSIGGGKENLRIDGIVGITRTAEDVQFATTKTSALGDEFDINARWILTKQASIHFGIGFLFSSSVMKDTIQADGGDAKSTAIMYVLGADLKF